MGRTLIWIEQQSFLGWGCSDCAWMYNPAELPFGESLNQMLLLYEQRRDKDFAAHVCAQHPRTKQA